MNEAYVISRFVAQTKSTGSIKWLGLGKLHDLNPFACFHVEHIDTAITEAEQIGLIVGDMKRFGWPHDLFVATATSLNVHVDTKILKNNKIK